MNICNQRIGFTLIEILVVISIVGILSSVIYASFSDARHSAQNKSLAVELKEVQLALEVYKAQNGEYPAAYYGTIPSCDGAAAGGADYARDSKFCPDRPIIVDLAPEFIAKLPSYKKSANASCIIFYQVESTDHGWYKLTAENCVSGDESIEPDDAVAQCPSYCGTTAPYTCGSVAYSTYVLSSVFKQSMAVYSAGGQCK
jgi:prepilin-type N-terminal cleavage/methylation domain-containing protein